jgi:hypothetical protein
VRATLVLLALLLAGCGGPSDLGELGPAYWADAEGPAPFDQLTDRLAANSTDWQEFLLIEDEVPLAGNASIQFTTGRGMGCQGDADNISVGQDGWLVCAVRLAARPEAVAQAVRALGIGYDAQRLTARQAGEPIEWRTFAVVENGSIPFDSGWRRVDLAPAISDPVVTVEVRDPCVGSNVKVPADAPNVMPAPPPPIDAILNVEVDATHGQPFVRVDLGASSRPGDGESKPYADHGTGEHGFEADWDTVGPWRNFTLALNIDLDSAASPTGPMEGPCQVTIGRETQEWTIDVGIVGADGAVEFKTQKLQVDVYLNLA